MNIKKMEEMIAHSFQKFIDTSSILSTSLEAHLNPQQRPLDHLVEYLLVVMLISMGLGICVTMLTVFLSGKSKGYIGMIMKAALLMIVLMNFFGMLPLVTRPFYMFNPMGFQLHAKGGEMITLAILFGISLILTVTSLIKSRKAPAA